jgi:Lon protease-like protein
MERDVNNREAGLERLRGASRISVFPLPNVVFFPHAPLGLHIFEPRYRRMTEDALASDRLIAVVLLKPGWERDYAGSPPVCEVASAGVIEEHQRLPDGRFNIRLRGVSRIRLGTFVQSSPYRIAEFQRLEDGEPPANAAATEEQGRLIRTCSSLVREIVGPAAAQFAMPPGLPFPVAVNAFCQGLAMDVERRQALLEVDDVTERCRALIDLLTALWKDASLARVEAEATTH